MVTAALDRSIDDLPAAGDFVAHGALPPVLAARSHSVGLPVVRKERKGAPRNGLWLTVVALAVVSAAGVYKVTLSDEFESTAAAGPVEAVRSVKIARPTQVSTSDVLLPATIRPWQTTSLHARVSGYLTAWHADLGASVKAGELLATIETPELEQELAEGEALASEAAAAAVQARAEREEARADLRVAEAQLARIQAETELAKTQLARREKLLSTKAISQDDYDTFSTQVTTRNAEVAAATAEVLRRRTNLQTRGAVITVREATAQSRRANVERLKELQVFKRIVAPFDGVVTNRTAEVGMLVTAGKESLYTIEDMSRVRVQVNVPQSYAQQARRGVEAAISVPESALPAVRGTITRTADSVDSANRTMLAEIELDNASHRYQPGSYAQVTLSTVQDTASWTVPSATVSMQVAGPHVAVVDEHNQIEIRRLRLGRDLGGRVVVADGILGQERLVVNPGDSLMHGATVRVEGMDPQVEVAQR